MDGPLRIPENLPNENSLLMLSRKSRTSSGNCEKFRQTERSCDGNTIAAECVGPILGSNCGVIEEQESSSDDEEEEDGDDDDDDGDDGSAQNGKQELVSKPEKPVSKSVTFLEPEDTNEYGASKSYKPKVRPSSSQRPIHSARSNRHIRSPGYHSSTVMPYVDSRLLGDEQRIAPSSALKIYTLAKMRRPSSKTMVVNAPTKLESTEQCHVSKLPRDSPRHTPTGSDVDPTRTTVDHRNVIGAKVEMKAEKEHKMNDKEDRTRKDMVNWCLRS